MTRDLTKSFKSINNNTVIVIKAIRNIIFKGLDIFNNLNIINLLKIVN